MSEPHLQDRQRLALQQLLELAQERARNEDEHERGHQQRVAQAHHEFQELTEQIRERHDTETNAAIQEFQAAKDRIVTRFDQDYTAADRDYRRVKHELSVAYEDNEEKAET